MINFKENKKQWHIYLIVAAMLILSIISWFYFAKSLGSTVLSHFDTKQETTNLTSQVSSESNENVTAAEENPEDSSENYLVSTFNLVDSAIDKVGSKWSVYRQSAFSKIDSILTYFGTGEISSVQVIGGKDGWLFYGSKTDSDPIGDYEGTNSYSKKEMDEIYKAAFSVQNELENKGIQFAILVPPNKENMYPEYMPDTYTHTDRSRTDLLIDYLSNKGINIFSPKAELLTNHNNYQVYYKYDTHWNQLGAYIGVRDILQSWGIEIPELKDRSISSTELRNQYHLSGQDDLAKMLGLRSIFSDEIEYTVDGTQVMDWETFENEQTNSEISHFHNEAAAEKAKILLVGDSFRSSMAPSLIEQFSDVYVVHRSYFTADMIDEINPNYVVVEYVERYSKDIKNINKLFELQ